jgi:hypothetical protein
VVVTPEKGTKLVQLVDITQSVGLFLLVCFATAAALSLAIAALARMERATVPAARRERPSLRSRSTGDADRVSSPGGCTYGPRTR